MGGLTWGDQIENQAKQLLKILLSLEQDQNCNYCKGWHEGEESNIHILKFEEITLSKLESLINQYDFEEGNYLRGIKDKKNQINKLIHRLITLKILYDQRGNKTQGNSQWKFYLKLPSKNIEDNLQYFCTKWEEKRPPK